MEAKEKTVVSVRAQIHAPLETLWQYWTTPESIVKWNQASDDWHTTKAENDLRVGGSFNNRMEAKDGSNGFDFTGIYQKVILKKQIDYTIADGRKVTIVFSSKENKTEVIENFEVETSHTVDLQRSGWQAILDNFKHYVEKKQQGRLSNSRPESRYCPDSQLSD
jgi:uncharacterized protein YndB with AHSA1/START domain